MKKALLLLSLAILCMAVLAGCNQCNHQWVSADYEHPKTCSICGLKMGKPLIRDNEDAPSKPLDYEITEGTMIFKADGVAYLYNQDGEVVKTYTGWMTETYDFIGESLESVNDDDTELTTVPWRNEQITQVIIEENVNPVSTAYWFLLSKNLVSVQLPASLTEIGTAMFHSCYLLTTVKFAENSQLTTLGNAAFFSCSSLSYIVLPDSLTIIGDYAFTYCRQLYELNLPSSLTSIGDMAFERIPLTDIQLPEGLLTIGNNVFDQYQKNIIVPNTVTSIGYGNFDNVKIPNDHSNLYVQGKCLINRITKTLIDTFDGFILPNDGSITAIGEHACENRDVIALEIPQGVTYIGESAFSGCNKLTSVTLPEGLTSISAHTFEACTRLESVLFPNSLTRIEAYAFIGCIPLKNVIFPDGLRYIGDFAFSWCEGFREITLPGSVTEIGNSAFLGCQKLESISLPDNLEIIGDYAFKLCRELTEITLPDSLVSIGNYAFFDCENVTSFHIPASVTHIGISPFDSGNSLESMTVAPDNEVFYIYNNCLINRNTKTLVYGFAEPTLPTDGSIEIIGESAFGTHLCVSSIKIPDGVTYIGATSLCSHIVPTYEIPLTVTFIGNEAFNSGSTVIYAGTMEQWKAIEGWEDQYERSVVVNCTDGTIKKRVPR